MKLDNRRQVALIWFRKFLSTLILTLLVITIGFSDYFKTPVLGIDKSWYLLALAVIYIGLLIINIVLKPHYVYFSDNADKIILRYYPTRIFNRKKNSIEIPRQNFVSWEIEKFLFGRCEMIFLHGKFKSTVARYPGVSLSAVSHKDRERIKAALNVYAKKK
jgi:hypothetical protein